ncbi:MAG: ABC transporter ATP-binding protein [Actinomycetota bacterium]
MAGSLEAPVTPAKVLPFRSPRTLLEVRDLAVQFPTDFGVVKAVDGISYTVDPRETLAIVGESGSGKSVSALAIMGLVPPPGKVVSGDVTFQGRDLLALSEGELRKVRGNQIGMIFQDPLTSLNPVFSVGNQIAEAVRTHERGSRRAAKRRAVELMELVGISNPAVRVGDYPHQFSGGMRQRVMIAMAIAMNPALLIADEPTTALDVTIQAQILDLLKSLQGELGMALILITHDLGMVAEQADRVVVMYAGHIAEYAEVDEIYSNPLHPYTLGLMGSVTRLDRERRGRLQPIPGQPPSLIHVPPGCPFHPRCPYARDICRHAFPDLDARGAPRHLAACHFAGNLPEPEPTLP